MNILYSLGKGKTAFERFETVFMLSVPFDGDFPVFAVLAAF